ncbi:unnamed protein product [Hermetia illucens]|uniref:Ubiquinone biosynthesis O-methyltransferase, mitochondrial n=1 Tax=Hermetia illucens TaxID=343691 RepID=A0A7R8YYZ1_HERIL|nr:ubiquinone biosynthesis O-methyltransferase, mitochondrial [Hermetia illucens]CAD7089477.1 unnamed protein product [Hermetia illucens]
MLSHKICRFALLSRNLRVAIISARNIVTKDASTSANTSTVDVKDVANYNKMAQNWWDLDGFMKPLHSLNTLRVPFIRDGILATREVSADKIETSRVLEGINILEVGCGGGFLTENLARLHANVTGIDAGKDVIRAAERHVCQQSPDLLNRIQYKADTIENFAKDNLERYDAVVLSEVVEHVENVPKFISSAVDTLKPGGSIFITTPNRTIPMLVTGIILAENVFRIVPQGTHQWNKFITPLEMQRILESLNCTTVLLNGFFYEFWRNTWRWVPVNDFCYALQAVKRTDDSPEKV